MDQRTWNHSSLGVNFILLCFIFLNIITGLRCFILEKTVSACNGPCASVNLKCPGKHKIAIREALFGVHPLGPICPRGTDCERAQSDICCEKTPSSDCMIPYPVDRLEPLHKGCSGKHTCKVNIVGNEDLATVCPTTGSPNQHNTTYTILDYVCVNDTFIADFCSDNIITVSGRTVFVAYDANNAKTWKDGQLCTCVAHSTTFPVENPISVFVVDIRLNQVESTQCSDSTVSISAGKTIKDITCKSVHDPGFPYPFVSVLNSTTVALAQLVLKKDVPDFVWLGFEASLDEEIRVSCGVHGWKKSGELEAMVPATKGEELPLTNNDVKTNGLPIAAIIGGFIGGVVITAIIASIIVLAIKKTKRGRNPETDLMEPYATIDSSPTSSNKKEPRRSVKHDELMVFEAVTCNYSPPWDVKGDSVDINSEQRTNDSAAYVDAATVRKKKKIDKQKSRELPLSPAQQTNSRDVEYVDAGTVRKKKLADRKSAAAANEAKNNPKRQNATDRKKASEYDRLSRETPRECPTPPGYSHLRREYMDIEPFTLVNENYIEDQGIYENSENVNQEQTNTKKLVPPKNKDSDGGSDSSFKRSPSPVSHYELEKNS